MKKRFFIIACIGHSASKWVAMALSKHPAIVCAHSAADLSLSLTPDQDLSREDSLMIYENERVRPYQMSLDEVFSELAASSEATAYGNSHMYTMDILDKAIKRFPPQTPYKVTNLVRHPVNWVESGAKNFVRQLSYNPRACEDTVDKVSRHEHYWRKYIDSSKVTLDNPEVISFVRVAVGMAGLASNFSMLPPEDHTLMEKITTDRDYFASFVNWITDKTIEATDAYLDEVFSLGKINTHTRRSRKTPSEQFAEWDDWKQKFFADMVERTEIDLAYGRLGYDFSFLPNSKTKHLRAKTRKFGKAVRKSVPESVKNVMRQLKN